MARRTGQPDNHALQRTGRARNRPALGASLEFPLLFEYGLRTRIAIHSRFLAGHTGHARSLGCCRVTLEVQENNGIARQVYQRAGFTQAVYGPTTGGSLYCWEAL